MRILIITSCTGEKTVQHPEALILDDFLKGDEHIASREKELKDLLAPAEQIYSGQQHLRLMQGIRAFREHHSDDDWKLDLWIVSAGYGVIPGNRKIAPYECTFQGMKKKLLRKLADARRIPENVRSLVSKTYDLSLIFLGDTYLEACSFDEKVILQGPTLCFCGTLASEKLPKLQNLKIVTLSNTEAKRFSCGLVGLKGEIGRRLIGLLSNNPEIVNQLVKQEFDILARLDESQTALAKKHIAFRANPKVDQVIQIPQGWWDRSLRKKLRYFIPEWDDLVDPSYDFETDTHSGGRGNWSNEVYAHQIYSEPTYDGILVSRIVAEQNKRKKARLEELGVHRYLRVPPEFFVMGDCGAFGYISEEVPPYQTNEILDYYTRLGFNYGVSIDHLIVPAFEAQKQARYELTIYNAEQFLKEHRARGLLWEPVGAVQGWDSKSYAEASRQYVAMGYGYIALGGLVRSSTPEILKVLEEVHKVVPPKVKVHLFGLARFRAIPEFLRC